MNLKMDQKMDGFGLRLDKMDQTFGELKQFLMGLQNNQGSGILDGNKDSTISEETILGSNSTPKLTHNHPLTPISIPSTIHNIVPFILVTTPVYTYSHITISHHVQYNPGPPPGFYPYQHTITHTTPLSTVTTTPPSPFNPPHFIPPYNTFTYQNHVPPPPFTGFISPQSPHTHFPYQNFHINPKIEFPKFEGHDSKGWVSRAEQYFEFILVDNLRRMKLPGLHFEGTASTCLGIIGLIKAW